MLVKIIPHGTSFSGETLTYSVGDSFDFDIKIWQLLKIPYGKKEIFGIVADILENNFEKKSENWEESNGLNIKSIISQESNIPILAQYQITMIERLSLKYMFPIHKSLSIFLSEPILRRLQKYHFPLEYSEHFPQEKAKSFDFYISKNEIISPEKLQPFFKKNLAIILPDDILVHRFEQFFTKNDLPFRVAFYPNDMTDTKRSQAFIDIYNKKSEIIIWSRRLIQYNLSAYDEIWYCEDSFSRDYYHYPTRIAYTDFLAHIVDSEQFSLKIFTTIPSISALSKFHFFHLHHF